jgi:hemolysin activation/secretion protein
VVAGHGEVAADAPREVQSVVGGLNGLRAYGVQALAGTQIWRFNGEARWVAARDMLDLASVGAATFVDAARAWGTGSDDSFWHHDVGVGLRLSFPHASLHQVARLDVAFPLSPTRDGRRSPVFSFGSSQAF